MQSKGGRDFVKDVILRIKNELPASGPLRLIQARAGEAHLDWRKVEQEVKKRKLPVYVRNNHLVWPRWRWHEEDGKSFLSCEIERFTLVQLSDMVAHHAVKFQKWDSRLRGGGGWKDVNPPAEIIGAWHGAGHWDVKDIVGVITSPTMRPDLSIMDYEEATYDEATQLYYKPEGLKLPPLAPKPKFADAEKALEDLNGLLDGFPFEGEKRIKEQNAKKQPGEPKKSLSLLLARPLWRHF